MATTTSETDSTLKQASLISPPSNKHHKYRIASIPADGIGPEVVSAAIEVVTKLSETMKTFEIEFTHIPWGTAYYKEHGRYVDENVLDVLRSYDATLFGSVGAPGKSSTSLEKLKLIRYQMSQTTSLSGVYFLLFVARCSCMPTSVPSVHFQELNRISEMLNLGKLTGFSLERTQKASTRVTGVEAIVARSGR